MLLCVCPFSLSASQPLLSLCLHPHSVLVSATMIPRCHACWHRGTLLTNSLVQCSAHYDSRGRTWRESVRKWTAAGAGILPSKSALLTWVHTTWAPRQTSTASIYRGTTQPPQPADQSTLSHNQIGITLICRRQSRRVGWLWSHQRTTRPRNVVLLLPWCCQRGTVPARLIFNELMRTCLWSGRGDSEAAGRDWVPYSSLCRQSAQGEYSEKATVGQQELVVNTQELISNTQELIANTLE